MISIFKRDKNKRWFWCRSSVLDEVEATVNQLSERVDELTGDRDYWRDRHDSLKAAMDEQTTKYDLLSRAHDQLCVEVAHYLELLHGDLKHAREGAARVAKGMPAFIPSEQDCIVEEVRQNALKQARE